jgi:hypothetical protein
MGLADAVASKMWTLGQGPASGAYLPSKVPTMHDGVLAPGTQLRAQGFQLA